MTEKPETIREEDYFEQAFEGSFEKIRRKFETISAATLHITLVGSMNAEKERVVELLTGIRLKDIKPSSAGKNKIYAVAENIFIVDTPGYNKKGIRLQLPDDTDLVLFFLDAPTGIQQDVRDVFQEISAAGKEMVAVIDRTETIREETLDGLVMQVREELGINPVPVQTKSGEGLEDLNEKIVGMLEDPEDEGKVLYYLKISLYKRKSVDKWIRKAAALALAVGALPLPGSDMVPLTALQMELALKIAWIFDITPDKEKTLELLRSTLTGNTGKQAVRWAMETLDRTGWEPGKKIKGLARAGVSSLVAAALTFAFGWACYAYFKSSMSIDLNEVADMFRTAYEEYKNITGKTEK